MSRHQPLGSLLALAAVLTLGACETINAPGEHAAYDNNSYPQRNDSRQNYSRYGVVQSVEQVRQESPGNGGSTIGLGTLAGAVVGGIVGNQVGSGRGNTAATVIGAAGGAYVGHELENRPQPQVNAHRLNIRMEDGSHQSLPQSPEADIRVGDRVQIENGVARRY
jgi:outer membrane lipoprotein SlyB